MTRIKDATLAPEAGAQDGACPAPGHSAPPSAALNAPPVGFDVEKLVHQSIEEQAWRTPDVPAVEFNNLRLTYRELNARADVLAVALQALGVGPDVPVGICLERSVEMMVGLLGILKAGGCYVPLDPTYPKERLKFVLTDARPPVLLTQTSLRDLLAFEIPNLKLLCVDDLDPAPTPRSTLRAPHSNDLAYIIYTSGSTGQPKGVMITHRNLANFFAAMDHVVGVKPGVWLAVTSISFDISVLELFWTLARGFTVVIHSEDTHQHSIPEQILRHGVTHIQCTPSLATMITRTPGSSAALRQLHTFLVGGEALPTVLAKQLRQALQGELLNMYGPTETTVWSATHRVREVNGTVPIGRPIANTAIHILDEQLQPVPTGAAGELFIGGEGVARGYLNRTQLTAERFVADPFCLAAGARLYRTGDIGRLGADGAIEFLGRVDQQIKLRGHRIELGEIESVLRLHPAVQACVVQVWTAGPDDKRLAAYLVPENGATPPAEELRRLLESKLPDYMIPASFTWLEAIPLTPNGKTNRHALPRPDEVRPELATAYVPPRTSIEETIAGIWRQVLGLEKVGVQDNFYDLGGSSLLLTQIHAQLCLALNAGLPIVSLFEHRTIAALAGFLAAGRQTSLPNVHERAIRQRAAFARRQAQEFII